MLYLSDLLANGLYFKNGFYMISSLCGEYYTVDETVIINDVDTSMTIREMLRAHDDNKEEWERIEKIIDVQSRAHFIEKIAAKSPDQTAKTDAGKPRLSLVPLQILYDIAAVREYAVNGKYKDPGNWKRVSVERYRDALMRHLCAYITDPESKDEESGLPHLYHIACNVAFLCALEKENEVNHTVK